MDRSRHWGDHRTFMSEALMKATSYFHVILQGNRTFGWHDRSIGSPVIRNHERYWLRVVSENKKWIQKDWWEGNFIANEIKGIPKPNVIDFYEWEDGNMQLRAELMTIVAGRVCSPTQELRSYIDLPDNWWLELRNSLLVLSSWKIV